jgi:hypothetical protein
MFPDHLPFILPGALVGAGSLWPEKTRKSDLVISPRQHVAIAYKCLFDQFVMDLRWQASLSRFIQISPEWGWLFIELSPLVEPSPHSHSWYHA